MDAFDRLLICFSCETTNFRPITGPCGHTRCFKCCLHTPLCCGEPVYPNMCTDALIQRLMDKRRHERNGRKFILMPWWDIIRNKYPESMLPARLEPTMPAANNRSPHRPLVPTFYDLTTTITLEDLKCVICLDTLTLPVATSCGHTFCKFCLMRLMVYKRECPLCKASLDRFHFGDNIESKILKAAREILEPLRRPAPELPDLAENEVPVIICTVSFPTMNCPLLIREPYNRTLIRLCLQKEGRKVFGIVSPPSKYVPEAFDCGTLLEIRDAILLQNGDYIVTAIGLSRFTVQCGTRTHGYYIARVNEIVDQRTLLSSTYIVEYHNIVRRKLKEWLDEMVPQSIKDEMSRAYGGFPELEDAWWPRSQGPKWIWWAVTVIPTPNSEKLLCHLSRNINLRLLTIDRVVSTYLDARRERRRQNVLANRWNKVKPKRKRLLHSEDCPLYNINSSRAIYDPPIPALRAGRPLPGASGPIQLNPHQLPSSRAGRPLPGASDPMLLGTHQLPIFIYPTSFQCTNLSYPFVTRSRSQI